MIGFINVARISDNSKTPMRTTLKLSAITEIRDSQLTDMGWTQPAVVFTDYSSSNISQEDADRIREALK